MFIFFGSYNNERNGIRNDGSKPDVSRYDEKNILNANEYRNFWVRWDNNLIRVGKEGNKDPFLSYQMETVFTLNYIGIRTAWGGTGDWIFQTCSTYPDQL